MSGAPIKSSASLEALLEENRRFPPPSGFQKHANQRDPGIYERASGDVEAFWAEQAESLDWIKKWDRVLEWNLPWAKWFLGGQLNVSANCLDRHLKTWRRNKAAFYWEPELGQGRVLTYSDLYREVNKFANVLTGLGVRKGDRVTVYMGMIPELPISMLACARIGAPHSVVFGGFSSESLAGRINDAESEVVVTADGAYRRGTVVPLKQNVDAALDNCPSVEHVVVVDHVGERSKAGFVEGRDYRWHDLMEKADTSARGKIILATVKGDVHDTHPALLESQKGSCIRLPATWLAYRRLTSGSSMSRTRTSTGVPPISDG